MVLGTVVLTACSNRPSITAIKQQIQPNIINQHLVIQMERNDKPRSHSTKKTTIDTNLPTLKSSTLMNKAIVALSKVDIDSRAIREQKERTMRATSGAFEKEYQRSQSGFSMRKNKEASSSPVQVKGQRQFDLPSSSSFKLQLKDIKEEMQSQNTVQPLVIDKSKISSKSYGIIKGYSANSHSGPMLSYNEDRICIVTNLTKTNAKHKQISFFGVYDGNAGILKADFLRDNFHLLLVEDLSICADMESAMRRTLQRLTQMFSEDAKFQNDESTVSFAIVVIANEEIYYLQSGVCRSVLSQNLGENIFYPSRSETALLTKEPSRKAKSLAEIARTKRPGRELAEVQFRQFGVSDSLDFILLGMRRGSVREPASQGDREEALAVPAAEQGGKRALRAGRGQQHAAGRRLRESQQQERLHHHRRLRRHQQVSVAVGGEGQGSLALCARILIVSHYNISSYKMNHQDFYMYSHSSRFTGTLTGQPQYNSRYGQPFEMNTSTQHRQFHEMKAEMPSDVLELFKANQIAFLKAPVKPKCRLLDPVTTTCSDINSMFDVPNENLMEKERGETREEKIVRIARERQERNAHRIELQMQQWNPFAEELVTADPQKTLLVARLSYKTTQKTLKYEFEKYGIIKSVRIIRDQQGKSRGYAFIEFDSKDDFVTAYKTANYRKIDGHKVIVDFERGRTLLNWRPRRFAGGKGYLRLTKEEAELLDREEKAKRAKQDHEERERSRSPKRHFDDKEKRRERKSSREKKDKKEKKEKKERHRHREEEYL